MFSHLAVRIRQHPMLYWLIVGLCILSVTVDLRRRTNDAEAERKRWGTSISVLTATHPISAGSPVGDHDVRRATLPMAAVAPGWARELEPGSVARTDIASGEVIMARRISPGSFVAGQLSTDERAVAVPLDAPAPSLEPGDWVDLIGTLDDTSGSASATITDGRVLQSSEEAVTVAIAEGRAAPLATALRRGSVTIAVRRHP